MAIANTLRQSGEPVVAGIPNTLHHQFRCIVMGNLAVPCVAMKQCPSGIANE